MGLDPPFFQQPPIARIIHEMDGFTRKLFSRESLRAFYPRRRAS
jgi:hypothetical protein